MTSRRFHKPVPVADLDNLDAASDPATRTEIAHATAALLVPPSTAPAGPVRDEATTRRFVTLAETLGLEVIAEIWATAPAVSLPGALWRLYALREWITRSPHLAAGWFDAGRRAGVTDSPVAEVLAGVESPPGPDEVVRAADDILAGAFRGDFAIALLRASAFVALCERGRELTAPEATPPAGQGEPGAFARLATDLATASRAYRAGALD